MIINKTNNFSLQGVIFGNYRKKCYHYKLKIDSGFGGAFKILEIFFYNCMKF